MRRATAALAPLVAAALIALSAAPASACCFSSDPDDAAGKLDVSSAGGARANPDAPLKLQLETYERWPSSLLAKGEGGKLIVYFNTDGSPGAEFRGKIRQRGRGGDLTMLIKGSGFADEVRVRRPDGRSVAATIPGHSPPNPGTGVAFFFRTKYKTAHGACSSGCNDRAPDSTEFGPI